MRLLALAQITRGFSDRPKEVYRHEESEHCSSLFDGKRQQVMPSGLYSHHGSLRKSMKPWQAGPAGFVWRAYENLKQEVCHGATAYGTGKRSGLLSADGMP